MTKKKIKRNMIRCKRCGDIIESKHVHDFKQCLCGACFTDGGHDYLRRGWDPKYGRPEDVFEELDLYDGEDEDNDKDDDVSSLMGIVVKGGAINE